MTIPPPPNDFLQKIAVESVLGKATDEIVRNCWTTPNTRQNVISLFGMFLNREIGKQIPISQPYPKSYEPVGLILKEQIFPTSNDAKILHHKYLMLFRKYYPIHDVCGYIWYPFTKTMKTKFPNLPQIFAVKGGF